MKITESKLKNIIKESVKKHLLEAFGTTWYVVDDGGVYNVLSSDMFDEKGRYIENKSYTIDDFDIVKSSTDEETAWRLCDKLNRESEESSSDFSPSRGYFGESIEKRIKNIVTENIKKVLKEASMFDEDFDNITNEDLAKFNNNYYSVVVPEWALPALVNGDYEGLTDEEERDINAFERNFSAGGPCELANGMSVGDLCIPLDGRQPSFEAKNDINRLGAMCYRFALPAK